MQKNILWFREISMKDVGKVGGKNASLGELRNNLVVKGVNVQDGFAVTADAYFYFLQKTGLDKKIEETLKNLNAHDLKVLHEKGEQARKMILESELPEDLQSEIKSSYAELSKMYEQDATDV